MKATAPAVPGSTRRGWRWALPLLLALLAGLAVLPWQRALSQPLADAFQRALAARTAPPGLLSIDIDDASLEALRPSLGAWPFQRDVFALAIEHLRQAGARAIVLDVLLADPRSGDTALRRTLERPGAPVLLAAAGLPPAQPTPYAQGAAEQRSLEWAAVVQPTNGAAPPQAPRGIVTTPLDPDGRLRHVQLWHSAEGERFAAMPLLMWQHIDAAAGAAPPWPQDEHGRVAVAPNACAGCLPRLPFSQLWSAALVGRGSGSAVPPATALPVKDQVVVIGSSAVLVDRVMTVHGQSSGAEALALTYAALRDGQVLRPAPPALQAALLAAALLPALWVAQRGAAGFTPALRLAAALAVLLLVAAAGLLALAHIDAPLAAPLAALAAGTAAVTLLRQRWQLHERLRLEQARAVAAAASEAKTAFLANVSHEIRTPLNAVLGAAELLSATPLNERQRQHVVVFRQAGETLSDLINDLLDITKIEAGKLDLHAEAFALRPLLEHQLAMLRARAEQKGLTLELTIAAGLPEAVLADRRRLQQALTNLVGNAIKFTSRGSVRLEVQPVDGNRVRFVVSDTGIGIAASKLEAIFEPFVQADGSITRSYGGTGLGLAITRTVAQLMGGSVQVQSEPGRGSVFTLELPLPATELPPAVPATFSATLSAASVDPAPDAAGRPRRARVLLAEDNEVNVYIFTAMLEGLGLEIDQVGNGIAALEMARQRRYALIFMDVQMPGMDGLQATAALRQHEANEGLPRTPVVALTAHSYADDVQRCLQAGCDRHLAKPFTRADIVGLLEQWLPPDVVDAGAQGIEFAPPAAPGPLDNTAALARLGGDTDRHRRALDHAAVFVAGWAQDFDAAPARRLALAQDLAAIAGSVGAAELEAAALKLQAALQAPSGDDSAASLKAVRQAIAPVLLALAPGRSG